MCPKLSAETRIKMSLAKKGNQNAKGTKKVISDKTREKMSKAHIGKKHSDETKLKISNTMKHRRNNHEFQ